MSTWILSGVAGFALLAMIVRLIRWRVKTFRVIDGDSVEVNGMNCRLAAIDAPEMPSTAGILAREHLFRMTVGKSLSYRTLSKDRYGRRVILLYVDGRNVNRRMVADGFARAYRRYSWRFVWAEIGARMAGRGLWKQGRIVNPEKVRRARRSAA
jgi:endonuclease YncB( thermonuclease family)